MDTLTRPKLSDMVYETLANYILDQGLQPGDKLPSEQELTTTLGIGRSTLREGIRQLEAIGLLTSRQGYGVTINEITMDKVFQVGRPINLVDFLKLNKQEILDLMDFRLLVEVEACRLAADRISEEQLVSLETYLNEMETRKNRSSSFITYDMKFHMEIAQASGSCVYPSVFKFIEGVFRKQQAVVASLPGAMGRALEYHKRLVGTLKARDGEQAALTMRKHLENTIAAISRNL